MDSNQASLRNVTEIIVPNDLCIGCGLCAGICPPEVLKMEFNAYGEYIPIEFREGCLPKCNLCLQTCPFWDQSDNESTLAHSLFNNEPEIAHATETGYVLQSFAGYSMSDAQRHNGASGGLTTWLLQTLLKKEMVDRIIAVEPTGDAEKLFQFAVFHNPQELQKSSRSAYYPVEMSEVIKEVLQHEARYVIVGLPCFLKAIRLAMRHNRRLRRRIVFLVGLVCGQTKSTFFSEYLCASCGGEPEALDSVQFRTKDYQQQSANQFNVSFTYQAGDKKVSSSMPWHGKPGRAWSLGWFKPNACNFCDDIFAEVADVSFMDAWLERYMQDNRGTNFALIRNPLILKLFRESQQNKEIFLEEIPVEDVIQSQRPVIDFKRDQLSQRLEYGRLAKLPVPTKRISAEKISLGARFRLWIEKYTQKESKETWRRYRMNADIQKFERRMWRSAMLKRVLRFIIVRVLRRNWSI